MRTDTGSIRDLVGRYARAVDERDRDALLALFAPDALLTLPPELARGAIPAEMSGSGIGQVIDGVERFERTRHVIDSHHATVEGDVAHGETACTAHHLTGGRDYVVVVGYRDTFRSVDGDWRILRRDLHVITA